MDTPTIEIIETIENDTNGDDCQYCAGKSLC